MKYNIDKVLEEINLEEKDSFTPTYICKEYIPETKKRKLNWAGICIQTFTKKLDKGEIDYIPVNRQREITKKTLLNFIQQQYNENN